MIFGLALVAGLAAGPRLDADLAVMPTEAPLVVVVPHLGRALDPTFGALSRLKAHPTLSAALEPLLAPLDSRAGIDLFSAEDHARLGLDLTGSAWFVGGPGGALALPFAQASDFTDYASALLGVPPMADGDGLLFAGVRVRHGQGRAVFSHDERGWAPWFDAGRSPGEPVLSGCPHGPGEADVFVRARDPLGGVACATIRFEADRVRLDARYTSPLTQGWLGAGDTALLDGLGANPAGALVAHLGPGALKRLRAAAQARGLSAFAAAFDGRVAATAGPGPTDLRLRLGMRPAPNPAVPADLVQAFGDAVAAQWRPDRQQVMLVDPAKGEDLGSITRRADVLEIASPKATFGGDLRQSLRAPTRIDAALAQRAALLLYVRFGGVPHDGQPFVDALTPALQFLKFTPDTVRPLADAAAWVLAHLSEGAVAMWVEGDALRLAIEVVHL